MNCKSIESEILTHNLYLTTFFHRKLNFEVKVFPGATDSRYLRKLSIPVLGFSPMNCTPILLHEHDEFLDANIYIEGIQIYSKIIEKLAMS